MTQPDNKSEVLSAIRSERQRLDGLLAQLSPEQMLEPGLTGGWSAKDVMAHLSAWEGRMVRWVETTLRGEVPQMLPEGMTWADLDAWNQQTFQKHRHRPLDEVQAEFQATHAKTLALIEATPETVLMDPGRFAWLEGEALVVVVVANTSGHYREHADSIQAWLQT